MPLISCWQQLKAKSQKKPFKKKSIIPNSKWVNSGDVKKSKSHEILTSSNSSPKKDNQRTSDDARNVCDIYHKKFIDPVLFKPS